jgi:hypothetical protein
MIISIPRCAQLRIIEKPVESAPTVKQKNEKDYELLKPLNSIHREYSLSIAPSAIDLFFIEHLNIQLLFEAKAF